MPCDEAYNRHFHKKQKHVHEHRHEGQHDHLHEHEDRAHQKAGTHEHQHDEVLHAHPFDHEDPHHQPDLIQMGVTVYSLEKKREQLLLDDVDTLEFHDDQVTIHNIPGQRRVLTARLKRIHFVNRGKVLILLEQ